MSSKKKIEKTPALLNHHDQTGTNHQMLFLLFLRHFDFCLDELKLIIYDILI